MAAPHASCSATDGRGDQVEGPRAEAVVGGGERADRADLDRVAREVGLERLLLVDADLLEGAPLDQRDERVARDLLGEPGAPRAQHAPLAVEQHLRGDVDRLGEGALHATARGEARLAATVGHRLVLQRALAALVADRAVERVVDQEVLHHALLRLVGARGGELGLDLHALGDGERAGGLRLHPARRALHLLQRRRRGRAWRPRPGTAGRRRRARAAGGRRSAGSGCRPARRRG